jgi:20S proteasome alpha/beta subunit
LDKAKAFAEYLISETASQDPKVGGPIRIAEITPKDGYKELTRNEVTNINKSNQELNQQLRQFFLEGEMT